VAAINQGPIDVFTLGHLATGGALAIWGVKAPGAAAFAIGFELLERPLKDALPKFFPYASQDTAVNALWDAAAVMIGWWVVREIRS
jgi:hypothetical protein